MRIGGIFINIDYRKLSKDHIKEAINLVKANYEDEREVVGILPRSTERFDGLKKLLEELISQETGYVAISEGKLLGFLAGFKYSEQFGRCKGIYSPLYGNGALKGYKEKIYKGLYEYAADKWVKQEYLSHTITLFAHDRESIDTWVWQGFGFRCVDAIRKAEVIDLYNEKLYVKKATRADIENIVDLHREHIGYYKKTPIFFPKDENEPKRNLIDWINKDNHHLWIAYKNNIAIGYMMLEPSGETFISEHKDIMNITGAYIDPRERESKVGTTLLNEIQKWLVDNNYSMCGVDFESINNLGSQFWTKYFDPYTYSLARRIDERVLGF